MLKYFSLFVLVMVSVVVGVNSAFAYVSPGKPTGYVNDFTKTLSTQAKNDLENLLTQFHTQGKGDVSVVIISTLGGDVLEDYSIQLAREWGIGEQGKDNGVLFLVVKDDRMMRIEVGYGQEGVLTDAKSSRIIRDVITPKFKEGQYDAGITNGVKEILGVIDPSFAGGAQTIDYTKDSASNDSSHNVTWIIYVVIISVLWVASVLARSRSWWAGGVIGGVIGLIISLFVGFLYMGVIAMAILIVLGLVFDYVVSRGYSQSVTRGTRPPWWTGGGSSGGSRGGGFGGFGGGSFGGGGSSGRW